MRFTRLALLGMLLAWPIQADFGFVMEGRWSADPGEVRALAFAPDGTWVVAAIEKRGVIFNLQGGQPRSRGDLTGPRKDVLGAAVSPDGQTIALVDAAGALHLYDSASRTLVAMVPKAHSGRASAVSFTAGGEYVLTGGEDGKVKAWTPRGLLFAELSKGARHEREVLFVSGVTGGRNVISVGRDRRMILWQVDTQQALRSTEVEMDVRSAAFGGSGLLVLGLQTLQANQHWARVPGVPSNSTLPSRRPVEISTAPTRADEIQATDRVRLVDVGTGSQLHELDGLDQDLDIVGATPDGRFVAGGGNGGSVSIWDTATGRRITTISAEAPLTSVAFSPDGKRMALGAKDGSLSLYRLSGVGPAVVPVASSKIIIVILEPSELSAEGAAPRGEITQVRGPSLKLKGEIKSGSPIKSILVDGHEITSLQPDGSGNYIFNAYVPVTEPGRHRFELVAETMDGAVSRESFLVEREPDAKPASVGAGRRMALIVGISKYQDPGMNLAYASDDARSLYQTLINPDLGPASFRPEDVELLLDDKATASAINTGLRDFLQKARENDFVVFYFAGHGAPDPNRLQDLYLLPHDTDPNNIAGTGLLMRHVREAIAQIPARDVLILSDACHSAAIANVAGSRAGTATNPIHQVFLDKLLHASGGLAILTASEAAQQSYENEKWGKHGVFTYYLLKGLRGEGDADHDGIVALGELMEYVRDQVRAATKSKQIPAIGPTSFDRQMPLLIVKPKSP